MKIKIIIYSLIAIVLLSCNNLSNNMSNYRNEYNNDTLFSTFYYNMPIYDTFIKDINNTSYVFAINNKKVNCRIQFEYKKTEQQKEKEKIQQQIQHLNSKIKRIDNVLARRKRAEMGIKEKDNKIEPDDIIFMNCSPLLLESLRQSAVSSIAQMPIYGSSENNNPTLLGHLESIIMKDFKTENNLLINDTIINSFVELYKSKYGKPKYNVYKNADLKSERNIFYWNLGKKEINVIIEKKLTIEDKAKTTDLAIEYIMITDDVLKKRLNDSLELRRKQTIDSLKQRNKMDIYKQNNKDI